jgi:putative spermidine/putrescine transport system permease protein
VPPVRLASPIALVVPALAFVVICFLAPIAPLIVESFRIGDTWGFANYFSFFGQAVHQEVFWRTMKIAALTTVVSAVIGYPAARAIVHADPAYRGLIMGLLILPLMVSPVARTYAWVILLGGNGFINSMLVGIGVTSEPLRLLFTEGAVFIGLLQLLLPLMILPLVSALENLPRDVIAAARTLGANDWQVFWKVTLPLSREGLVIGGTLVFTGSLTAYITPAMLGGPTVLMLETLLYQKVNVSPDYVAASVITVILVVSTLAAHDLLNRIAAWTVRR